MINVALWLDQAFLRCPSEIETQIPTANRCSLLIQASLGEFFGHHDDFAVSCMHAWIDLPSRGPMAGVAIDEALRTLLDQFRLPGEAQK